MKISYADARTGELDSLTKQERWFGLLLGIGGTMLTLLIGGTATTVIEFLLSLGLKLQLVPPSKIGIPFTIFGAGQWLIVVGGFVGYRSGFDRTLEFFSVFWGSARIPSPRLATLYWGALFAVCALSRGCWNLALLMLAA